MAMTYLELKTHLESLELNVDGSLTTCQWEQPTEYGRGVLTSTAAFKLAKEKQRSPLELAETLAQQLQEAAASLGVVIVATGPYLNVELREGALKGFFEQPQLLSLPKDSKRVMFEYISANVAKRLHVGHMRNLNIGDSLRRLLSLRYEQLITDNHWGDWGIQFGIVIWAYKQNVNKGDYLNDPLSELQRLYVWGNNQKEEVEGWDELVRNEFKMLEAGDQENRQLWQEFLAVTRNEILDTLELFKVPPTDLEQGESFYEPHMKELTEFCDQNQLWQRDGEARYIDFDKMAYNWEQLDASQLEQVSNLGRCYLISSQGYTSYAFRDVAARFQWARDHEIDKAITVTDDRQQHNFQQAFAIIAYLADQPVFTQEFGAEVAQRLSLDSLHHVPYGRMRLDSGEMSTRTGQVVALLDLYREVESAVISELESRGHQQRAKDKSFINKLTLAALRWQDLQSDPLTAVTLQPEKIVSFEGDTGVYQLYSYARLKSILDKNSQVKPQFHEGKLNNPERQLVEYVFTSPAVLTNAIEEFRPSLVVNFVRTVTQRTNSWYSEYSLKDETDNERQQTMAAFIVFTMDALKQHLQLLGIEVVDQL